MKETRKLKTEKNGNRACLEANNYKLKTKRKMKAN